MLNHYEYHYISSNNASEKVYSLHIQQAYGSIALFLQCHYTDGEFLRSKSQSSRELGREEKSDVLIIESIS